MTEGWTLDTSANSQNYVLHSQRNRTLIGFLGDIYRTTYVEIEWSAGAVPPTRSDQIEVIAELRQANALVSGAHYLSDIFTGLPGLQFFKMRLPLAGTAIDGLPQESMVKIAITTRSTAADPGGWVVRTVVAVGGTVPTALGGTAVMAFAGAMATAKGEIQPREILIGTDAGSLLDRGRRALIPWELRGEKQLQVDGAVYKVTEVRRCEIRQTMSHCILERI
jgi:hypothetical protein